MRCVSSKWLSSFTYLVKLVIYSHSTLASDVDWDWIWEDVEDGVVYLDCWLQILRSSTVVCLPSCPLAFLSNVSDSSTVLVLKKLVWESHCKGCCSRSLSSQWTMVIFLSPYGSMVGILSLLCLCLFVRLRISQRQKKIVAWNFAWLFDYYLGWASPILVNFDIDVAVGLKWGRRMVGYASCWCTCGLCFEFTLLWSCWLEGHLACR